MEKYCKPNTFSMKEKKKNVPKPYFSIYGIESYAPNSNNKDTSFIEITVWLRKLC